MLMLLLCVFVTAPSQEIAVMDVALHGHLLASRAASCAGV